MAATRSEGEQLHAAMMTCRKRKPLSSQDQAEEYGCDLIDMSPDETTGECESSQVSKRHWMDSLRHRTASTRLDEILMVTEEQWKEIHQHHLEAMNVQSRACDIHDRACDIQQHAVDIQERTSLALLDSCTKACCLQLCRSPPRCPSCLKYLNKVSFVLPKTRAKL